MLILVYPDVILGIHPILNLMYAICAKQDHVYAQISLNNQEDFRSCLNPLILQAVDHEISGFLATGH